MPHYLNLFGLSGIALGIQVLRMKGFPLQSSYKHAARYNQVAWLQQIRHPVIRLTLNLMVFLFRYFYSYGNTKRVIWFLQTICLSIKT